MRWLTLASLSLLLMLAACSRGGSDTAPAAPAVYEVVLQGSATTSGRLVLRSPVKLEIPVSEGQTGLDLALTLRAALQEKQQTVLCTEDRGDRGFVLMIDGRTEMDAGKTSLGGVQGSVNQLAQRRELVETVVREYYRTLRLNDGPGLKRLTSDAFDSEAAKELGTGIELVQIGAPAIACHTASIMVEVALPGGQHDQRELQVASDSASQNWKITSSRLLSTWKPSLKSSR